MVGKNNHAKEYPQKIYDFLVKPDFREYLSLAYDEVGGNKELFSKEIENIGQRANDYLDILFEVAYKEFELSEKDDN